MGHGNGVYDQQAKDLLLRNRHIFNDFFSFFANTSDEHESEMGTDPKSGYIFRTQI